MSLNPKLKTETPFQPNQYRRRRHPPPSTTLTDSHSNSTSTNPCTTHQTHHHLLRPSPPSKAASPSASSSSLPPLPHHILLSPPTTSLLLLHLQPGPFLFSTRQSHRVVYHDHNSSDPTPPSLAYLLSRSKGDLGRILLRLLHATYHPRNQYLLHLERLASPSERLELALKLQSNPIFRAAQNVHIIGKADFFCKKGSSCIAFTLHGASILLRLSSNWDWFISLTVEDYPLLKQDGAATYIQLIVLFFEVSLCF